jgi:RNA polymerase sigma-70 factor, ECF subfamily
MANEEDIQLVAQAKADPRAFDTLYNKYSKQVYNYFWYRIGHDSDTANDLTQDTFIRAFQKLSAYEVRGYSYLTYLLRIAHNLLVNYWRDNKTLEDITQINEVPTELKQALEDAMDIENMWQDVQKLPLLEKEVLLLRYRRELDIDEIAKIIDKSENAVNLLLSRARKRLKNHINRLPFMLHLPDVKKPQTEQSILEIINDNNS